MAKSKITTKKSVPAKSKRAASAAQRAKEAAKLKFPRHSLSKALRVPRAIMDQNAGKPCTPDEAAEFVGVGRGGPFAVEISSSLKYGLLERPTSGKVQPSALAKKILRPQNAGDEIQGYQQAVLNAPTIAEVYQHYRGENLPEDRFLQNTLADTFGIPAEAFPEFKQVFIESLETAQLVEKHGEKQRIIDVTAGSTLSTPEASSERIKKLGKGVSISATDTCFVMQPFASPLGDYYEKIYKPAIEKVNLTPVRADAEIFGTGKIIDQVFQGIVAAKVLVAELTSRNPNVFYELGVAHALKKPVVLVSATEADVPFDLQHIRVIYYDVSDPFWGQKLIDKVAENILSAIQHPEEAVFRDTN